MLDRETWSDTRTKRAHHNLVAGQTSDPKLQSHSVKHCLDGLKKWRHSHTNHKMQSFCWYALSSDLFHFPLVGLIWKYTKLLLNYLTLSLPKANFTKPRKVLNVDKVIGLQRYTGVSVHRDIFCHNTNIVYRTSYHDTYDTFTHASTNMGKHRLQLVHTLFPLFSPYAQRFPEQTDEKNPCWVVLSVIFKTRLVNCTDF